MQRKGGREREEMRGRGMKRMKKEKERERRSEMRRMERGEVTRKTGVRGLRKGTREEKGREPEKRKEGGESICLGVHTALKQSKASLVVYSWYGTLQSKL